MQITIDIFREFIDRLVKEYGEDAWFSFMEIPVPHYEYPNEDEQSANAYCQRYKDGIALYIAGSPDTGYLSLEKIKDAIDNICSIYNSDTIIYWVFVSKSGDVLFETDSLENYAYRIMSENGSHDILKF